MTAYLRRIPCLAIILFLAAPVLPGAQSVTEFQKRRQAVRAAMEPDSVMILRSAERNMEGGPFRQENNLFYLTGINEPDTFLILYPEPGGESRDFRRQRAPKEILFIPASSAGGQAPADRRPPEMPGFETVRPSSEFRSYFDRALLGLSRVVYLDYRRTRSLSEPLTADEQLLKEARDRGASFTIKPAASLIDPLRRIKSEGEIETLKTAAAVTAAAVKEAMRAAKPGLYEYQVQSIIEHVFSFNGARRPGFSTIVGSGENSCILHWSDNTRRMKDGDVAVVDIGAEYEMYTADITRTIPIGGTFSARQRDIYNIVLQANQAAIDMTAPGVDMRDVSEKVDEILTEGLVRLGLIKDRSGLREYYYHGLSHPIGLQVHDVGGLGKLEPGMVITIEPGLYLRKEGFGIRIEDDVLIIETGHTVITEAAPKTVEEIEALMKQNGMDYSRYWITGSLNR